MNNQLGHGLILAGLVVAACGAVVGLAGGYRRSERAARVVQWCAYAFCAAMVAANLVMEYALLTHDFSVGYVAQVGSRSTPTIFTIVSLWSALEGSILFWGFILSVYLFAFAFIHRREHRDYMSYALAVILVVGAFFAFLLAGPANPFKPAFPVPEDGPGPNALLQNHYLMIVHPPMLYCGYVGMTIPFGIAIAALLRGRLADAWMGPLRRWMMVAWTFQSIGITLGAWWAYAVLGWGGYWAWDPVENASFMPWLVATAFIHSTVVQERRGILKAWTLALALASFWLTLLGTFMTRSGVFNSVHSFTQSAIGPTFLVFIAIVLLSSVALLTLRSPLLASEGQIHSAVSRETAFFVNNLLFAAFTFTVLLGTLYPLITEAVRDVKVSVGEPYFNKMTLPLMIGILFLMGVGPVLPWGRPDPKAFRKALLGPFLAFAVVVATFGVLGATGAVPFEWLSVLAYGLSAFVVYVTFREIAVPVRVRIAEHHEPVLTAFARAALRSRRRFGGYVVHLAVVGVALAIASARPYQRYTQATLTPGSSLQIGDYRLTLDRVEEVLEPNRRSVRAALTVTASDGSTFPMTPGINYYATSRDPIATPNVHSTLTRDLYMTLMAYEKDGSSATVKAWVFPMVAWLWRSLPILVLGSLFSLWPRRSRRTEPVLAGAAVAAAGGRGS